MSQAVAVDTPATRDHLDGLQSRRQGVVDRRPLRPLRQLDGGHSWVAAAEPAHLPLDPGDVAVPAGGTSEAAGRVIGRRAQTGT